MGRNIRPKSGFSHAGLRPYLLYTPCQAVSRQDPREVNQLPLALPLAPGYRSATERNAPLETTVDLTVLFDIFPHLDEWCLNLVVAMAKHHDLYYGQDYTMEKKATTLIIRSRIGITIDRYNKAVMKQLSVPEAPNSFLLIFNGTHASRRIGIPL